MKNFLFQLEFFGCMKQKEKQKGLYGKGTR